jgi:nucleoside-diphosphate-sugar epimerase
VDASRDFTFVADTAHGIILAAASESARGETINLGSGTSVTIRELVKEISALMDRDPVAIAFDQTRLRPWDVEKLECDYTKAKRILGWEPKIPLREGLLETIKWLKANPVRLRQPFRGWPKSDYKVSMGEG